MISSEEGIRLAKRVAADQNCSRREADDYIAKGWVKVDGVTVSELGTKILPTQKITLEKAAQATLVGDVFDDAATGQGLLNYFLRAINCGAITLDEVKATGLTMDEIRTRSFLKILDGRKKAAAG